MIQPLWKTVWRFFEKLGIKPLYDPAIPLLGIYPEETKIGKDSDAGRDWRQEEKGTTEDDMARWHHGLDGLEFE